MEEKTTKGISSFTLRIMVSAYLLWVIWEIVSGIAKGEITGNSALIFGAISVVLLAATGGLFLPELKRFFKRQKKGGFF